ncbi:AlpA family phage regulatory protein, partial [Acidovorax sp. SD340]
EQVFVLEVIAMESSERIQHQQPRRLEDVRQVGNRIGRGASWIWAAVQRGDFPAPRRLSARCTRWDSRAVDEWIEQQFAQE